MRFSSRAVTGFIAHVMAAVAVSVFGFFIAACLIRRFGMAKHAAIMTCVGLAAVAVIISVAGSSTTLSQRGNGWYVTGHTVCVVSRVAKRFCGRLRPAGSAAHSTAAAVGSHCAITAVAHVG